jgi:valyl-tRNA synthetase
MRHAARPAVAGDFNAAEAEARIYAAWEEAGAFAAGANAKPGAEAFSIMIPPPNVTGVLHVGHAFNNTLQDVLIRWHRMRGFDTLWQPGTDHAGIATQMVVERELAKGQIHPPRDGPRGVPVPCLGVEGEKSGGTIRRTAEAPRRLLRLVARGLHHVRRPRCARGRGRQFPRRRHQGLRRHVRQGLIYRGKRLVNWDPHFETAISDLEVENIEVQGHMWHFKYPLAGGATYTYVEKDEDGNVMLEESATTSPSPRPGPRPCWATARSRCIPSDERYAPIVGMLCEIPVGPKEHRRLIPIITDEYPDPDFGSGAVKITGAHDFNDYAVAKRGGIPCYRLMDGKGTCATTGCPMPRPPPSRRRSRKANAP